jgi:carbonic anhydrase
MGGLAAFGLAGCQASAGPATSAPGTSALVPAAPTNSADALARLREGNARFAAGAPARPDQGTPRRSELANAQKPFAQILACIDSRVPPELIFDQGLGDLLVARSAGEVLDRAVTGSLEYGVSELKIPLLVVLGHQNCGAVKATVESVEKNSPPTGTDIDAIVDAIRPAVDTAEAQHAPDLLTASIHNNVTNVVNQLNAVPTMAAAQASGALQIVGGYYDLTTGVVTFS